MPNRSSLSWRAQLTVTIIPVFFYLMQGQLADHAPGQPVKSPYTETAVSMMGCEGSLGENLFTGGDFGTGADNIPPVDPKIAPGYSYARQGPPNDGLYVITNNTGAWPGLYPTWIRIRDNSPDPNGYMMVVNASFEPGTFYQQTITGLCANTTFEFTADVINLISRNTTGHIKPNVSFFINDELKFSTGDIAQDETWKTYGFSFTTGATATDLVLSIRNNAPGGTGNDLALDNISFRPCGPEAIILPEQESFVCVDEDSLRLSGQVFNSTLPETFIQWQVSADGGATFTDIPGATKQNFTITNFVSGTYYYRFLIASTPQNLQNVKCRVFSYPKEVTVLPKFFNIVDTICSGLVYDTGHSIHTQSGVYVDTLTSSFGCDSIVTLNLTVVDDPMITADLEISPPSCFGIDDGAVAIQVGPDGYPPFAYSLNDSPQGALTLFDRLGPGSYQVRILDKFGCSFEDAFDLAYPRKLTVDIGSDTMVPLGMVHQFQSFVSYRNAAYQWQAPLPLDCSDCPRPSVLATGNGTFSLQVTNEAGCTAIDSLRFSIDTANSYKIFAPNAFSPNSDGINDRFTIFSNGLEVEQVEILQIYDRWGNLLFTASGLLPGDMSQGWDGRVRGQAVDMGVYIYRVDVLFIDGMKKTISGAVTVVR